MKPYCSIQRLTSLIVILLCIFLLISCGDEDTDNSTTKEDAEDAPLGLSGNTYRNQDYLFKISNLPVEEWSLFIANYPDPKKVINLVLYGEKDYIPDASKGTNLRTDLIIIALGKGLSAEQLEQTWNDSMIQALAMDIEVQVVSNFTSGEGMAKHYKIQKKEFEFGDIKQIQTKDGFIGHRMDGYLIENPDFKVGYAFFVRSAGNASRIYRLWYMTGSGTHIEKKTKVQSTFDQIFSAFEFNIL